MNSETINLSAHSLAEFQRLINEAQCVKGFDGIQIYDESGFVKISFYFRLPKS